MKNKTLWEKDKIYGDYFYKMAIGKDQEMFSSVALSNQLKKLYKPEMKILDVGCGVGHYLRSLRNRLDVNVKYQGIDSTKYYIDLARKAFGDNKMFKVGSIFNIPEKDNEFDIVMCNNVILHLPSPAIKPIKELIRCSKKYIIIRTLFGKRNYIIQELRSESENNKNGEAEIFDKKGKPSHSNYFNIYTTEYYSFILNKINPKLKISYVDDREYKSFDNRKNTTSTGTQVINGMQVSGSIILDWKFVIIKKP